MSARVFPAESLHGLKYLSKYSSLTLAMLFGSLHHDVQKQPYGSFLQQKSGSSATAFTKGGI